MVLCRLRQGSEYPPFLEKLKAATERADEFRGNFAVLILDADNFKDTVNTYGYDASRQILKNLGGVDNCARTITGHA